MNTPEKIEITPPDGMRWTRLATILRSQHNIYLSDLADQIEAQFPISEPSALGTVIRDTEGTVSVLADGGNLRRKWREARSGLWHSWDEIPQPTTVLHEGYTLEEER